MKYTRSEAEKEGYASIGTIGTINRIEFLYNPAEEEGKRYLQSTKNFLRINTGFFVPTKEPRAIRALKPKNLEQSLAISNLE